ncbi:MAG TPA: PAS domain S-box protein [Candidatus Dormibacteraeota bacterium]|jgi:PAS domain S-box-containing protein|nr:PAS domain S-box protein [Candidatus Dormibacteraeota bacterium]
MPAEDGRTLDGADLVDALRIALDASPDGVLVTDDEGEIAYVNHRLCELTGYVPGELIGDNVEVLVPGGRGGERALWPSGSIRRPSPQAIGVVLSTGLLVKGGGSIPVDIALAAAAGGGRTAVVFTIRDASPRRDADEGLLAMNAGLARTLVGVRLEIEGIRTRTDDPGLVQRLEGCIEDLDRGIRQLRDCLGEVFSLPASPRGRVRG